MKKFSMALFKLSLLGFLLIGAVLVLGQLLGLVVRSPGIVSGITDVLALPMTVLAAVAGILGFAMSYLYRWDTSD